MYKMRSLITTVGIAEALVLAVRRQSATARMPTRFGHVGASSTAGLASSRYATEVIGAYIAHGTALHVIRAITDRVE